LLFNHSYIGNYNPVEESVAIILRISRIFYSSILKQYINSAG
jgi:hypothetical protein